MYAFVDVQGFKADACEFIPKEIAILTNERIFSIVIKPPYPFEMLSKSEKKLVSWVERNKKISWNEGFVPFTNFRNCVEFLKERVVFVKGEEKAKWLRKLLKDEENIDESDDDDNNNRRVAPTNVHNLEDKKCPRLGVLYERYKWCRDIHRCPQHRRICAYKNVQYIKKWSFENNIFK